MITALDKLLKENNRRLAANSAAFNPYTGEGSIGQRFLLELPDFPIPRQWLPQSMAAIPLVRKLRRAGSLATFISDTLKTECTDAARAKVIDAFVRLRCLHDFPFWAATFIYVKRKGGGDDVLFVLTRPQRKFVELLEQQRLANRPIRIILLKARQWGGSTTSQLYMAWLQLIHRAGLNSVIVSQTKKTSYAIKDMFDRALNRYPIDMLYPPGAAFNPNEPKIENVSNSSDYKRIPQRNCKITVGTYENPDAIRGDDYNLVHCSEVGLWTATPGKSPEDVVRSACSGVLNAPYTMIVYESTANGTGNFFQREYDAAKAGLSQFQSLFISWFDIDNNQIPFESEQQRRAFAEKLLANRRQRVTLSNREEPGQYLYHLWELGATLEAINWYVTERSKCNDHSIMASEAPSDDLEAFVHSGQMVFSQAAVEQFKAACRPPLYIGDVAANADTGTTCVDHVRFVEDSQGLLYVWDLPDPVDDAEQILDRYLVVVDIGGRSNKADFSVITVFDRIFMMPTYDEPERKPIIVAQWYGHIDIDLLAWKAAQIATLYDNALLVIESNTLETHDPQRQVDGDQSLFILNQLRSVYSNLYARRQSAEDIRNHAPIKYGFHTNVSTKPMIISTLIRIVREHLYIERDARCLDEYLCYERKPNGAFGAIVGKHDDLLMTRAIGLHICFYEMDPPRIYRPAAPTQLHRKPTTEAAF